MMTGVITHPNILTSQHPYPLLRCLDDDPDVLRAAGAGAVEELHGRLVVVFRRALEEDHLALVAVDDLAELLRELIGRNLILVDEDAGLRHETKDDLVLDRGRREIRGRLWRDADQISHLHDG